MAWHLHTLYKNIDIYYNGVKIYDNVNMETAGMTTALLGILLNGTPYTTSYSIPSYSGNGTAPWDYATFEALNMGTLAYMPYEIFQSKLDDNTIAVNDTLVYANHNLGLNFKWEFRVSAITTNTYGKTVSVIPRFWYTTNDVLQYVSAVTACGVDSSRRWRMLYFGLLLDTDSGGAFPVLYTQAHADTLSQCTASVVTGYYSGSQANSQIARAKASLYAVFSGQYTPPAPSTDPYNPGGTSEGTNEGTGDFDDTSDAVPIPLTSSQYSAVGAGFVNLFTLEQSQVLAFGNFLFDPTSDFTDILRLFDNVLDSIISFGILPFTPSGGSANQPIYLASVDTGATGTRLSSQFETVDCGSVDITEFYGAALDYAPYTNIELVLPYCGTVRLAPEEVMGKTISVEYHVDCLTGACMAFVYDGDRVLSQVPGNVLSLVPYTSGDFRQAHAALLGIVGTVGAGLVTAMTGGMTAPMLMAGGASLATNVMNMKGHIARGGGSAGASGYMGVQTPYIVITRPRQCLPDANGEYQGYPLYTYELLGDLSGFTKVRDIHLEGVDCTEAELIEIETLLKEGVIL